jgi:hypothetical protein
MKTCVLLILGGLALPLILSGCGSPEDIEIGIEAPLQVKKGDEFVVVARVANTAKKTQTLVSLDIGDKYLDGVAIVKTEPGYKEAGHVPIDNTMSYVFKVPVDAGEEIQVHLYAKAIKSGDYKSEVDFCINSEFSFLTKPIRTIVE